MYPDVSQKQNLMGGSPSNKIGAYAEIQPSSIVFLAWYPKNPKMKTGQILQHFFGGEQFFGWEHHQKKPLLLRFANQKSAEPSGFQTKKSSGKTMAELSGGKAMKPRGFTTCALPP